ncbi:Flp family type IVb pilin [Micromonospora cathayae]|uniref:Flp family type IVb pilin n=1 Tax=Micromonospora cathayae TaxID=3028804 RepID=A0ABY7ZRE2_9ACTN|nr:Flp family type IVb pilin [Micromonospora sp. HUAS 3]WDZ85597.1 Flp family type IVb pilin [Micromonospora sp. HUAS 3]
MNKLVSKLRRRDDGATAVEYGLLVALIAVAIAATVFLLGGALDDKFTDAKDCVTNPSDAACSTS